MKNFLKQVNLFYGVVILLISILFLRPSLIGQINPEQLKVYLNIQIYYAIGLLAALISLVFMNYIYTKVKYGVIKSVDDIRYIKPRRIMFFFMAIAVIAFLGTFCYEFPKLSGLVDVGFVGILLGKSTFSYSIWGMFVSAVIVLYVMFFTKALENELPRRRRSKQKVKVDMNDFFSIFIPHIPVLINLIVVVVFFVGMRSLL